MIIVYVRIMWYEVAYIAGVSSNVYVSIIESMNVCD
jgi:hypothetical protein